MRTELKATRATYAGLFFITLATLMYEILLTRIFSVTMWYHFAFLAISVAMFGMTAGAIIVYLLPGVFSPQRTRYQLGLSALGFAVSIVISFLTHLSIPFITHKSVVGVYSIALNYVVIALPFVFSGICVCLALTRFPGQVSRLYAADLAGAALGCILFIYVLRITDGPTAVVIVAAMAGAGALFFSTGGHAPKLKRWAILVSVSLFVFSAVHTVFVAHQKSLLRLIWVKGQMETRPIYEKWNSFSRIGVWGDPNRPEPPFGWGISPTYPADKQVRQLGLNIDAIAYTPLTAFDGDLNDLEYLKYDVTNLVHYIRPQSDILAIGAGGGRDVLSALVFDQKSATGVEINEDIIDAVNRRFGDFTGHLDRIPNVRFVNDEARSYIARQERQYDVIQVSLIDTWAATASGAFVFTENALYTREAWKIFLEHITPQGVLTFSRWYFRDRPGEAYRLISLAVSSLKSLGITQSRKHIILVKCMITSDGVEAPVGVATVLVSKSPFTHEDVTIIDDVAQRMKFDMVLSPRFALDDEFAAIASGENLDAFVKAFPINIAAPTDDNPFFFHMLRLKDIFNRELLEQGTMSINMKAVYILGILLFVVIGLTLLCIIIPLALKTKQKDLKGSLPLFLFFASIGLGFMLVEVSQMQRLIVFLGHPTYGLSVVLFAMLLSSGLGSYSTQKIGPTETASPLIRLSLLLGILVLFGLLTPQMIRTFQGSVTPLRILIAVIILFPLGLFMGMAFPLGMKIASSRSEYVTPWLWGINGATSVCASVFAVAIALSAGISTSFWTGFGCYGIAVLAFMWTRHGT